MADVSFPMSFRECPHDGKYLYCTDCRIESETRKLNDDPAKSWGYDQCSAKSYFASRAMDMARLAGADRKLMQLLEDLRDRVGNTGD